MMSTSLKVILAATAIAAVTSPVLAQSESRAYAAPSASTGNARGSVAHTRTSRLPAWGPVEETKSVHKC
jgi:hypothetical protein